MLKIVRYDNKKVKKIIEQFLTVKNPNSLLLRRTCQQQLHLWAKSNLDIAKSQIDKSQIDKISSQKC